jgi:hypothetical protein
LVQPPAPLGDEALGRRGLGAVKRFIRWLQKTTAQFLVVLFFCVCIFLVLAFAQWGSGSSCGSQFPKWFGCVLHKHESLAAGLIGAAAALFAAWIAWTSVQRQLEVQQQQARTAERAYISGGGGYRAYISDGTQHVDTTQFVLTVQNYGKTPGTVTAYAVCVCDRADLPPQPAYLEPTYRPTPFDGTYPPGGGTLPITPKEIPPSASNPIAYGRLWYKDVYGKYHFSFILPLKTPHDHTSLVGISYEYTSST